MKLVVLASGRGSNFEAIAKKFTVSHLICNKENAPVLELAKKYQVPTTVLISRGLLREDYNNKLHTVLSTLKFDYLCLAGYMLLLPRSVTSQWWKRVINIHPSLLPKYKGLNAVKQALEAGEKETGCTVHFVTEDLDGGPILGQKRLEILKGESLESLTQRLLEKEHELYVEVLEELSQKLLNVKKTP
jgi:phosphoribosylglycinamide formyltransferase-1